MQSVSERLDPANASIVLVFVGVGNGVSDGDVPTSFDIALGNKMMDILSSSGVTGRNCNVLIAVIAADDTILRLFCCSRIDRSQVGSIVPLHNRRMGQGLCRCWDLRRRDLSCSTIGGTCRDSGTDGSIFDWFPCTGRSRGSGVERSVDRNPPGFLCRVRATNLSRRFGGGSRGNSGDRGSVERRNEG